MTDKDEFLHTSNRYYGEIKPENLLFNANLQEFASKVDYICSLETGGKINPLEAYEQIKTLWEKLDYSKKQLNIGKNLFDSEDGSSEEEA
ncbi:hypothetical protein [Nostoc sp. 106C]|uniref:DUF7219 family protein n=1 Tax=Nostoc sp. 106C TaxID=1932667 RepID=UPI000A36D401|nr:hypothetical protein [Nostoc sp. 106C]OUL25696.1 hypothetical protein BV378_15050 [Nostoc sp. RF31YmG]OUL31094.1 hypothetical protein BV375_12805 [Nostoc sp. 106C]